MSNPTHDDPSGRKASAPAPGRESPGDWQSTGADPLDPPTQFAPNRDDYLDEAALDVGRQTRAGEHELFVSCNPAPAMQQQFEHLRPEFIAVHDAATASSRKLLSSLASASGRATQKLVIRRQGYGTALATIHFVELPSSIGTKLRMYSTDCETEPAWRQSLAHVLLAFSRLGVIMVGDLKSNDIAPELGRLKDGILRGPWHNRQLLLLPLGSASSLVGHGMELARNTEVNVRTAPQVSRSADAWGFISGTWNRLTEKGPGAGGPVSALGPLSTVAAPLPAALAGNRPGAIAADAAAAHRPAAREPSKTNPGPSAPPATSPAVVQSAIAETLRRYVRQVSELTGVVGCAVFDAANGSRVAFAGSGPSAASLAAQGARLMAAIVQTTNALDLGHGVPEAAITLESHHLLLRAVPNHPGLALHAVLDRATANLTLVRLQVLRMDTLFDPAD